MPASSGTSSPTDQYLLSFSSCSALIASEEPSYVNSLVSLRYVCILQVLYIYNMHTTSKKSALSHQFRRILIISARCQVLNSCSSPWHVILPFAWHAISCILGIVLSLMLFFSDSSFSGIRQALHAWCDTIGILCDSESAFLNRLSILEASSITSSLVSFSQMFSQSLSDLSTLLSADGQSL